ncbi:MAG: NUDIX hydrolase [Thermoguttaceae bacterium]|jgi:ADP-ribose pyrophosphatase|nr:NUDIX hydrolase [Thermoguttaceae bacterium]
MTPSGTNHRRVLAEGRHVRLVEQAGWEWAERVRVSGVVAVAAVTPDGQLVLTEQYRPPVETRVLDLPAGLAGDLAGAENESLLVAARRELMEETGYESDQWRHLSEGPTSPGMTNEMVAFYLALYAERTGPGGGDASETIDVHVVPLKQLHPWLESRRGAGVLIDPKVYVGAYFASGGCH